MNELIVKESDVKAIENKLPDAKELQDKITAIKINSQPTMEKAVVLKNLQKSMIKDIEEAFNQNIEDANKLHKSIIKSRNKYLNPAKAWLQTINGKIRKFEDGERIRLAEIERKAKVEAERIAEEERQKELADMAADEEVTEEEIEEKQAVPVYVEPVQTRATNRSSVSGVSYRKNWQWKYDGPTGKEKLIDWLYANRKDMLLVDELKINKMVKAMEAKAVNILPGIIVENKRTVV